MDGIAFSFSIAILPGLSKDLQLPESKLAVISSVQLGVYYLFGPVACAFINHYGFRAVGICGCVCSFAGIFIASHIASFPAIIILYGVIGQSEHCVSLCFTNYKFNFFIAGGIGFGMIYTASIISVGYYFEKYRALSTGIAVCGSSVGAFCLPPLFACIADTKDWGYTMRVQSCFIFVSLISSLAYRPLKPTTKVPLTQEIIDEIVK